MFLSQSLGTRETHTGRLSASNGYSGFHLHGYTLYPTPNGTKIRVYKSLKALIFHRVGIAHMAYFSAILPYTPPSLRSIPPNREPYMPQQT